MRHINYLVLLLVACCVGACSSPKNDTKDAYPMFWTWLDYQPGMNFDSICTIMNEAGIDGVMLNAPTPDDYRAAIPIAQKHGIEVYAWLWTMNLEHDRDAILKEHPEWFSVNRNGQSLADTTAYVDYYKFMCPALPEVREFYQEENRGLLRGRGFERYRYRLQPFRGRYPADYPLAEIRYRARSRISAMGFWLSPGYDREVQGRLRI